jgi:hypothetical protein
MIKTNKKYLYIAIITCALLILSYYSVSYNIKNKKFQTQQKTAPYTNTKIKIAFTGDQGNTKETHASLEMIKKEKAQAFVVLGDFDYKDNPKLWLNDLNTHLGEDFPVLAVLGNHEEKAADAYIKVVQGKIDQLPKNTCAYTSTSSIGLNYTCTLGPVFIAFTAPDIAVKENIQVGGHAKFLRNSFAKKNLNSTTTWNICAWHKVHEEMQLGNKKDNIQWDIYDACKKAGAYIVQGHDHVYARSKTILDFKTKKVLEGQDDTVFVNSTSTGVSILGLGGHSIRKRIRQGDAWWASTYTSEKLAIESDGKEKNTAGILFCTFDSTLNTAPCYFKTIDGKVKDEFMLQR